MHLAVTIRTDDDLGELRTLIANVRKIFTSDQITILEAPREFDYPYPFPVVNVTDGPMQGRHFGSDAVDVLRDLSQG